MSIGTWFIDFFQSIVNRNVGEANLVEERCQKIYTQWYIKQLAINTAVNLIANTMTQATFNTFDKGKKQKKLDYYLFNVEPNKNYNKFRFWKKVLSKLMTHNECLVVMIEGQLYVADSFVRKEYALLEDYYEKVEIDGFKPNKNFQEQEVFYFKLHDERILSLLDGLYEDYGKLIEYSKNTYKRSNARRGIFEILTLPPKGSADEENLNKLTSKGFKNFFEAENGAILTLTKGQSYTDLTNQTYKNGSDSRDIRALIDDIFDYVAIAYQIPPQLLKGSVAESDNTWKNMMTFCINPLSELLENEINRKYYKRENFLNRTYLQIDTTKIRYVDIKDTATAIDTLTRNGVNTIDDNLAMVGREEEGLTQRYITNNIQPLEAVKGGE